MLRSWITTEELNVSIRRETLHKLDYSDVSTGRRLPSVHPGEVLLKDFIGPMGVTRYRVSKNMGVPQRRIDLICRGESAVTADIALRLAQLLGTSAEFWMGLQAQYDLEQAARAAGAQIKHDVVPLALAA